jgi:hypothetical protein
MPRGWEAPAGREGLRRAGRRHRPLPLQRVTDLTGRLSVSLLPKR